MSVSASGGRAGRRSGHAWRALCAAVLAAALAPAAAAALPSGYAYEMVSPPDKNGGEVANGSASFFPGVLGVNGGLLSPTGDGLAYLSISAFAGAPTGGVGNAYVASRNDGGWSTVAITPRTAAATIPFAPNTGRVGYVSSDLSKAIVETNADPVTGAKLGRGALYLRDNRTGTYRLLTPAPLGGPADYVCDPSRNGCAYLPIVIAYTPDLARVLISTTAELTPDAVGVEGYKGYVIETATGTPRLVTVVGGTPGTAMGVEGTTAPSATALSYYHGSSRQISVDGRYVFFSNPQELYTRDVDAGETVVVNTADEGGDASAGNVSFEDASSDGRFLFFTTNQRLVADDHNDGSDLYRWDRLAAAGHRLTLISSDGDPSDGDTALGSPSGVIASATDGRTVYFSARSRLVAWQPNVDGAHIYGWHDGTLFLVGSTSTEPMSARIVGPARKRQYMSITASGQQLAFMSDVPLLPGQSSPEPCPGALENGDFETGQCPQVYLYDMSRSTPLGPDLRCVSCLPAPSVTPGPGTLRGSEGSPGWHFPKEPNRALAADGRLFFESRARLLEQDVNGKRDVYTYKDGQLDLISSGRSDRPSFFLDATPDGSTAAFATTERLVSQDRDGGYDAYVARLGGGFPEPPGEPGPCSGVECRVRGAAPPEDAALGSESFTAEASPATVARRSFALARVTGAQRATLARTGRLTLRVRVSQGGTVAVAASARVGRRTRTVASARRTVRRAGTVAVPLRLSAAALRELRGRRLAVTLRVRFSGVRAARTTRLQLGPVAKPARG